MWLGVNTAPGEIQSFDPITDGYLQCYYLKRVSVIESKRWFHPGTICNIHVPGGGGVLAVLYTGMCEWTIKFKPKNMDSLKILHPKILGSCVSLTQ